MGLQPKWTAYHHVCNVCAAEPAAGRVSPKCGGCKLVSYCGPSHQKSDWKTHKPFCLQVQDILREKQIDTLFSYADEPTAESLFNYQTWLIMTLTTRLRRELTDVEKSLIYYPKICASCFKSLASGVTPIPCDNCGVEFYCSRDHLKLHATRHAPNCNNLRQSFNLFQDSVTNAGTPFGQLVDLDKVDGSILPSSVEEFYIRHSGSNSYVDRLAYGYPLSCLLTLVSATRQCNQLKDKTSLRIHFVGAVSEVSILPLLPLLFLWLDKVISLEFVFVGDNCVPTDDSFLDIIRRGYSDKNLIISFHRCLYHDYMGKYGATPAPDIITAFNSGFHEFEGRSWDKWESTIQLFLNMKNVLFVTTSYTKKEATLDAKRFAGIEYSKYRENNPYQGLIPLRNPERSEAEAAIYYENGFVSVFRVK